jgi:hypothetical protein
MSEADAEPDALRREVAASRGLSPSAMSFLDGTTVKAIEDQADTLAGLLTDRGERVHDAELDVFTRAMQDKVRRRAALASMFAGRPVEAAQPRDERGRYAGYDGGVRAPVPVTPDPERAHGELLSQLIAVRRLHGSDGF